MTQQASGEAQSSVNQVGGDSRRGGDDSKGRIGAGSGGLEPGILKGKRLVVTGGCGFIGSHLVRRLIELGAEQVGVVDSLRYGDLANLAGESKRIQIVRHTLGYDSIDALRDVFDGCDILFHLAAEKHNQSKDSPVQVMRANIEGSYQLYELARLSEVQKVVFSSSLYAYGRRAGAAYRETELPLPNTIYGISKLAGEQLLSYFYENFRMNYTNLRYLFVYGPRQFAGMGYKSVIIKNFERIGQGLPPIIFGDGKQALDYVYVDDVVDATVLAGLRQPHGEVLNIASGEAYTVGELVSAMLEVSGSPLGVEYGPADWTHGSCRVGDPTLAEAHLGWRARVSLKEGLSRTWRWLQAAKNP